MYFFKDLEQFAMKNDKSLSKVLIALEGTWKGHIVGTFTINKEIMEQMVDNFKNKKIDTVCDFEHQTLTGEIAPASGWIKSLEMSQESDKWFLYANVEWTKESTNMIQTKQYRYVSPVFVPNTKDQKSGNNIGWTVHSLSLTNTPFLEELGEVIANKHAQKNEVIELRSKVSTLEDELKEAQEALIKTHQGTIINTVDRAIEDKKILPAQRDIAIELLTSSPDKFNAFLLTSKPFIQIPSDNMFAMKETHLTTTDSTLNDIAIGTSK